MIGNRFALNFFPAGTEDWCSVDPCDTSNGGLCYLTNSGASYACKCDPRFEPVHRTANGIQIFERCKGE